jgi:SAM-dependent methyltransferase
VIRKRWQRRPESREAAGASPAPQLIRARDVAQEEAPEGGDEAAFETPEAHAINRARLEHLASLGLFLECRRVLDLGGGVGHLAQFFVERGCAVVATDARKSNVETMRRLYPSLDARVVDVEGDLSHLGRFDVVFSYGLLYHVENPILALRNMAAVCDSLLLIETMVCDSPLPIARLDDEPLSSNQALRGLAHRPSPTYLAMALNRIGLEHVYAPVHPPEHPDYRFEPFHDLAYARDGHLLRAVFIASRQPLPNESLVAVVGHD